MSDSSEEEYLSDLKQQRHMYAWCLRNVGTFTNEQSQKHSEEFYCYQPPEDKYRELVFHEDAWHWAMLKIKGEQYWKKHPELANPTSEYEKEWQMYDKKYS